MWAPPKEYFQTTPFRGLVRPFLVPGSVLTLLGVVLVAAGLIENWALILVAGLPLPIVGVVLALVYRTSEGVLRF